ncbi:hypothetical protein [Halorhabdus sp. SVX81]|uniref:hypothetical protein n=1 Tax=Halorhabdus sp. SVX81 TaxID=2978283 RepID=UPI0023D9D7AB|nr:hypothetical protein [Halorhabdus sp. SVX81]
MSEDRSERVAERCAVERSETAGIASEERSDPRAARPRPLERGERGVSERERLVCERGASDP